MESYNPFNLNGKTILITGASSGIGKSIAVECSKLGAKLIILGRNAERLNDTFSLLSGTGHVIISVDLNNYEAVTSKLSEIPLLNGVVYCAGMQKSSPVKNIESSEFLEVIQTNLFSTSFLNTKLLQEKKIVKNASLVFVSSTASGIVAEVGNAMYSASKGAISAYAKVVALELSSRKIRVNCIAPAMVKTELLDSISVEKDQLELDEQRYPFGYGEPLDVAYATIYLLSDASKWVTGTNIILDGGLTLK
jgi:NAD(P)-dependent dehydrogenase (short-subunit alcohol dehydrogenase family)